MQNSTSKRGNRPRRAAKVDIDYREYNQTGTKVKKTHEIDEIAIDSDSTSSAETINSVADILVELPRDFSHEVEDITNLVNQLDKSEFEKMDDVKDDLSVLEEDINDFLDENSIDSSVVVVSDIDDCANKAENLRTRFRKIHMQLKKNLQQEEYNEQFQSDYVQIITRLKEYITFAKERKNEMRRDQLNLQAVEMHAKERKVIESDYQAKVSANFAIDEIFRLSEELNTEFNKNRIQVTNEEISRRHDEFTENLKKLDRLSEKVQNTLKFIPDSYPEKDKIVQDIKGNYKKLLEERKMYEEYFKKEYRERDLVKEKSFKKLSLNIKLAKFRGFESTLDIYSFQSEFEKLNLQKTPKHLLPDLLKNNYLADPALALVKSVDNIEIIWERLKKAYGDPKIMLKKKFAEVTDTGPLWKMKEGSELSDGLMKMIN